jgi:hypothetical protein
MQANQLTMGSNQEMGQINVASFTDGLAGRVNSWLNRLVGCWHKEMSRPFSSQGQTYRVCLDCGARRQFNVGSWEMQGSFYYNLPISGQFRGLAYRSTSNGIRRIAQPSHRCA